MPPQNLFQNLPFAHLKDKNLSEVSTFKIGGPAKFYTEARTKEELKTALCFCHENKLPFFILGKGSNTLFDDRGFNGLVIANKIDYLQIEGPLFRASGGYSFARLGRETAKRGFTGLEFAAGIPATVGGAVFMNAGASGQETFQTLREVVYITLEGNELNLKKEEITFGYRNSAFQKMQGAVVEATFVLEVFSNAKETQRKAVEYRLKSQPYKDPSIGCIFRNPSSESPAALLIDRCGLKGSKIGGAFVSEKHANFIVNLEGAKAKDVLKLIEHVKAEVLAKTHIELEEEIRFIPYE